MVIGFISILLVLILFSIFCIVMLFGFSLVSCMVVVRVSWDLSSGVFGRLVLLMLVILILGYVFFVCWW